MRGGSGIARAYGSKASRRSSRSASADPRQRIERQAIAHRRVAGHQVHPLAAQEPRTRFASVRAGIDGRARAAARSRRRLEPLSEHAPQPIALELVVEPRVERIDVDRQPALAPQVVPDVLVARLHVLAADAERSASARRNARRRRAVAVRGALVGDERRVAARPARRRGASSSRAPSAAAARPDTTCPGRSARTPFAPKCGCSRCSRSGREQPLGRTERRPYSTRRRRGRRPTRTSARRPSSGARRAVRGPRRRRARGRRSPCHWSSVYGLVTRGDSWMRRTDIAWSNATSHCLHAAGDRRGAGGLRRAGERNVAFAGEQARRRIEADPAARPADTPRTRRAGR